MKYLLLFFTGCTLSCSSTKFFANNETSSPIIKNNSDLKRLPPPRFINDTAYVNLKSYSDDFIYDMKYATTDNFLKTKVYDCAECYLRLKTVKALINANKSFLKLGYRIKIFDCYRPLAVQQLMWKIMPDPNYVANPSKGSIHNRGGAVDLTLVAANGTELDMGTAFDYFGMEASHNYTSFSETIIKNRLLLKSIMIENNFVFFESEWWHYNLVGTSADAISNFKWKCN